MDDSAAIIVTSGICLVLLGVLIVGAIAVAVSHRSQQKKAAESIKSSGMRGEATVLDFQATSTDSESDDIAWVRLEMRVLGLEPYVLEKRAPLRYAGLLQKGMLVAVWVDQSDPHNPDKTVIEIQTARR